MRKTGWGAVAVLACLLALTATAGASNNSAFADPDGDASSAPDITSVQVSNDDAAIVTFHVSIPNRAALSDPDLVAILVDADGKAGTGCARGAFGAEYALDVLAQRYVFGRCIKGHWDFTRPPASFRGSYGGSTLTVQVSRRDLGGGNNFKFRVGTAGTSDDGAAYDFAPNVGLTPWSYRIVAPPQAVKKPPKRHVKRHLKRRKPPRIRRP
jgi:hypothetical protein